MIHTSRIKNVIYNKKFVCSILLGIIVLLTSIAAVASTNTVDETSIEMFTAAEEVSKEPEMYGTGLYIDSHFIAATNNKEDITKAIDSTLKAKASMLNIDEASQIEFLNKIELKDQNYPLTAFANNIENLLGYKNETTVDEKVISYEGTQLPVTLHIQSTITQTKKVIIEHKVKVIHTDYLSDGISKVMKKGYDGEGIQTSKITSIDGKEVSKEQISLEVTTKPVTEEKYVGVRVSNKSVASLNLFTKPYDGYISSYIGPRWGKEHKGIDITGNSCNGKPAVAAAPGKVILSGWNGGYGYCVIIDHGDNIKTLYAHFQKCLVEVGDQVNAGDEIGIIGSTGNSTGPHVHFEVLVEDTPVNPLLFVDYE